MTLPTWWAVLILLVGCPIVGGLPLIAWITRVVARKQLRELGTGNVTVSAAFYHGGKVAGILAVLSEAIKGLAVVAYARWQFPTEPSLEIVALILLVLGRYFFGRGAGTTNVTWGFIAHDWVTAALTALIGGVSFTILRERQTGKYSILVLLPILTALRHPHDGVRVMAVTSLSLVMALIYRTIPDDLDLSASAAESESKRMFKFFRGDRALISLDYRLEAAKVGAKAATLSTLKAWGYPVPPGWVLPPGDDPAPLLQTAHPSPEAPLVVRSSALGEDSIAASAAGQYESFLDITSQPALEQAILRCQGSYNLPAAVQYRQRQGVLEEGMAVLVQQQVQGVFSGVAFSRDPIARQGDAVVIEALPGGASQVVSGRVTPEQYKVWLTDDVLQGDWQLPDTLTLDIEGQGNIPPRLIQQVAYLARHLERRFYGIPQDIEWSYDGQILWLLQSRPITTLLPIWTRKIAAEVIPGFIHPLTWSINRPLTCGVWGQIFTIVLGDRTHNLDFTETATLHNSAAYFNATLLGDIFLRMGLPPESLESLTRGAKFSKPPIRSTLGNIPGLLRLVGRENGLVKAFEKDDRTTFQPTLDTLTTQMPQRLDPEALLARIETILTVLERVTYYNILAPLGVAVRQAIGKTDPSHLDNSRQPDVAATRTLRAIAAKARHILPADALLQDPSQLLEYLRQAPEAEAIRQEFNAFLVQYGYLGSVATDIAIPRWREDPQAVQSLLLQFLQNPSEELDSPSAHRKSSELQRRLDLKGRVAEVYNRLLAELRWSFLALEEQWVKSGLLTQAGDLFFLELSEIRQLIAENPVGLKTSISQRIETRRERWERDRAQPHVPTLVYGNDPPEFFPTLITQLPPSGQLRGIGASPGQMEGTVVILKNLEQIPPLDAQTVLVVPFTDAGWSPVLARVGGLIADVGGQLSHGAIVAREYRIPAVMNVEQATQRLRNGQQVRIDGTTGQITLLS
ncbi:MULTISPECIES: glycerol-3-phosphate acyltransferase [unclassified Leptolyngbya]|uniref:glycerol-3-phosphate acyltransferase n=1 Tax=unclassified Leptolyngbya TaxID=2650499 RepID=UPI00168412DD|nr:MULTISPECIES: glycerol-3-phosphate acyltransferase [unclassified Leptolyngbya]MBD1913945.1 glycerol-3-phosphate acyltransferase [Leptolyngbya sp. FACHB-8]MBD2153488.1 glycerol-3-phosphate acyltransferase [Leptolyngbya sp. FACHB-16]